MIIDISLVVLVIAACLFLACAVALFSGNDPDVFTSHYGISVTPTGSHETNLFNSPLADIFEALEKESYCFIYDGDVTKLNVYYFPNSSIYPERCSSSRVFGHMVVCKNNKSYIIKKCRYCKENNFDENGFCKSCGAPGNSALV